MITGNKGEWSEIYALFKLLGDKQLISGNADLQAIENLIYPIVKIIRTETAGTYDYSIIDDIVIISGGNEELRIPVQTFSDQAAELLTQIKSNSGTFSIPEIEQFMNSVNCSTIKAKSSSKSDIRIVIHDQNINKSTELGFSIKSKLGGDSTLLNAGKTTNFVYKVSGTVFTENDFETINNIDTRSKIKDRLEEIFKHNAILEFNSLEHDVFKNNLILIDSLLPNIIAELVLRFFTSSESSVKELTEYVTNKNPLNYDTQHLHTFYEYKIKRFLTDVALGMMPSKVWSGIYDATGGYLIVKEDGEILCYHIYNRNEFEDYLYHNTKLETASSSRHEFGKLFQVGKECFFKLNLQIRFK